MNIESIAKKAGVSAATVSLALNNRRGVSKQTRELILGIVKEVGYKKRPSRAVMRGSVQFLNLIRHGHTLNENHNMFISDYIDGITHSARDLQLRVEVASAPGATTITDIAYQMDQQDVAGFLVLGTEPQPSRAHTGTLRPCFPRGDAFRKDCSAATISSAWALPARSGRQAVACRRTYP